MNCLIIAAGHGSRLRSVSPSKPLTPVAGTPLIEHVLRGALAGGASAFTVVTGHEAPRLELFLTNLSQVLTVPIVSVRVEDWDRPNGHSVLAGAAAIEGDYLLAMADHLFDPSIIRRLLGAPAADLTLAVDRDLANPLIDMDDATKVALGEGGAIRAIGKTLERFDAVDTGLFRATPALAAAIEDAIAAGGSGSLSDGVQRLADQGRAATVDVAGARWLDVDDPAALAKAEALLG
ncbi:MAG TPA: NTP transferase domain-containing protein [Allosphingosinicella sp.]|nr:NTP transferase domain-containing protein [Allosphingosinicella sp.]